MEESSLETVAVYDLRHEAEVARALLDSTGIEAVVVVDDEGGLNPGFFAHYGVRVLVGESDAQEARRVLRAS